MNVRIVYMEIMRPFAESVLSGLVFWNSLTFTFYMVLLRLNCDALVRYIHRGPSVNDRWIYDSPPHSHVETKLRRLLIELGNNDKILGIQVHSTVYKLVPWYIRRYFN